MYELTVESAFEAAHLIKNYPGKCANLHGHNWIVEVIVQGEKLNELGILVDFKILKEKLNQILAELDHKYLNELEIFAEQNPTAENLAKEIFDEFSMADIFNDDTKLKAVKIQESPKSCVTYYP